MLANVINHIRNRSYMSGVDREKTRVKATGEVFTPTPLVQEVLDQLPSDTFTDLEKTFLDPSCGDGQFLSEALIRKMENGATFEQALSTIYGVDLMQDNVELCRERLLCGRNDLRHIVEQNIVCADALRYHYRFDGSFPYDDELKEQEFEGRLNILFDFG
jgi:type I restriction-modification system DNA methylase subunit